MVAYTYDEKQIDTCKTQFESLQKINPNHLECLNMHGNFLKKIVNDETEGDRTLERYNKQRQLKKL